MDLNAIFDQVAKYPLQTGVGAFLIGDSVYSIVDGVAYGDGPRAQGSRIARLAAGALYEYVYATQTQPWPLASKALGAYMAIDGTVSLLFKSIASSRPQEHLIKLRAARVLIGLLTYFFL